MTKTPFAVLCILAGFAVACDPQTDPDDELESRDAPSTEIIADDADDLLAPVTPEELNDRGIKLLDAAAAEDLDRTGPAVFAMQDIDDPMLSDAMKASMQDAAASVPLATTLVYVCPDNTQANVIGFGGSSAGWGSVGFTGGPVSSTSTIAWFSGETMLRCHGDRTLTPGYSQPVYVSRMSEVGAICTQHSGGGDFWFVCQTVPDSNCCTTGHGFGCEVSAVESCVCATDPFCCNTNWDSLCVGEVTSLGCGTC